MKRLLLILPLLAGCATTDPDPVGDNLPYSITFPDTGIQGIALDEAGFAYAAGTTQNPELGFGKGGVFADTYPGYPSVFVTRINRAGDPVRSTYLAGGNGQSVCVDKAGNVTVGGSTTDKNYPLKNAWRSSGPGPKPNCFLTQFDCPNLQSLAWSTVFTAGWKTAWDGVDGGSIRTVKPGEEDGEVFALAADQSMDHPTTDALMGHPGGWTFYPDRDYCWSYEASPKWCNILCGAFRDGRPVRWLTFGGEGADTTDGALAVEDGCLYLGGRTKSNTWPIQNAIQGRRSTTGFSYFDGCFSKLNPDLSVVEYSSYISGAGGQSSISGAAVRDDRMVLVGRSKSDRWPLYHQIQGYKGDYDWVVTRLGASGWIEWSTYLGGSKYDAAWECAIDRYDRTWITGEMSGKAVLVRVSADGRRVEYQKELGGQCGTGIALGDDYVVVSVLDGDNSRVIKEMF